MAPSYYPVTCDCLWMNPDDEFGDYYDIQGRPIHTLEDFIKGIVPDVSIALDPNLAIPYGTIVSSPELNALVGKPVPLAVTAQNAATFNRNLDRVSICVATGRLFRLANLNGTLTLII